MSPSQAEFLFRPIDQGRVVLLNQISKGTFGNIYTALGPSNPDVFKHQDHLPSMDQLQRVYAVKELPRARAKAYAKETVCHQAVTSCPGVLTLYHVVEEPEATYLITDYHPAGDLCSSLIHHFSIYEDTRHALRISVQLLDAVQQCHSMNVFHRDLKPDNILLADGGTRVVLADFGLSTQRESTVDFGNGSEIYMSPECLGQLHCNGPYQSAPSDVWSLGVVIFCIFFGHPPWSKPSSTCTAFNSFLLDPDFFLRQFPISIQFHQLLMGVFMINPSRRMTLPQLAAALSAIDPEHLTYRTNPCRVIETRSRFLRPIDFQLTLAHVQNQLGDILDTERFLYDRGFDVLAPSVERRRRLSLGDVLLRQHIRRHHSPANTTHSSQANAVGRKKWLGFRLPSVAGRFRSQTIPEISTASLFRVPEENKDESQRSQCSLESDARSLSTCSGCGSTTSESSGVPTPEVPRRQSLQPEPLVVDGTTNSGTAHVSPSINDAEESISFIPIPTPKPPRRNSLLAVMDGRNSLAAANAQFAPATVGFSSVHAVFGEKASEPPKSRRDSIGHLTTWLS